MRRSPKPILAAAVLLAAPLLAADFVVTRYDDPTPGSCLAADCSLREAVIAANGSAGSDRILLSAGTYELTIPGTAGSDPATGDLNLTDAAELAGVGAGLTTIDGNVLSRILSETIPSGEIFVHGVTFTGGDFPTTGAAGVLVQASNLRIEDSEFRGIGIGNNDRALEVIFGTVALRNVLFESVSGPCVAFFGGDATLENVTAVGCAGGPTIQLINAATATCRQCTLSDTGFSIMTFSGSAMSLENSIVVGTCTTNSSTITSLGGNLESPGATCGFNQTLDLSNVAAPLLGPLGDNGGPTRTIGLLAGSPAIDGAQDAPCLGTDARGVVRPQDGDGINGAHCDKGAFELGPRPPTAIFVDGLEQGDTEAWSSTTGGL